MPDASSSRRSEASPVSGARGRTSRVSVSLSDGVMEELQALAVQEGRSLSNLCAWLIESALRNGIRPE